MFNHLKNYQPVFQKSCTILHSHQPYENSNFATSSTTLAIIYVLLLKLSWWVWNDRSLWFWVWFLLWVTILSIFSCAYWPQYLLWRNVCLDTLPIFWLGWILLLSCKKFYTSSLSDLKIFPPTPGLPFYFLGGVLCNMNALNFNEV